jgi:hypothetical protein
MLLLSPAQFKPTELRCLSISFLRLIVFYNFGGSQHKGKKEIAFWVDPGAATQLCVTAATTGRTVQSIMEEALDDWFRKHRLDQATAP